MADGSDALDAEPPSPHAAGSARGTGTGTGTEPPLADLVRDLPRKPGVYLFEDADGEVLYVGKSADLRSRVASYLSETDPRKAPMVPRIADVETVVTDNETEALLLEATLIKRHRPPFNVRFADDKRYPYLKFTNEDFPRIEVVRRVAGDGARYFGPYPHVGAARKTMRLVRQLFEVRDCKEMLETGCLSHHLDMCTAPCMGKVTEAEYAEQVDRAARFLRGGGKRIVRELRDRMEAVAKEQRFEEAARLRDQLFALERTLSRQSVHTPRLKDRDVVGVAVGEDRAHVAVLFVRKGRVVNKDAFALEGAATVPEVLTTFLTQYYATALHVPPEVVVPEAPDDADLLADVLAKARGGAVEVTVPERGAKRKQVELATKNAAHEAELADRRSSRREGLAGRMAALAEALGLPRAPSTLAAVDVSHHAGRDVAAARVWFTDGEPDKARYRHLHVRTAANDDPAAIREAVRRTLEQDVATSGDGEGSDGVDDGGDDGGDGGRDGEDRDRGSRDGEGASRVPDVLLVDGGRDQVEAARAAVGAVGPDPAPVLVGLAKAEERLYFPDGSVLDLDRDDAGLQVLMHARDEAHRFANRLRRKARAQAPSDRSALEAVDGVGPVLAKRLLAAFGDVESVRRASVEEVAGVKGVGSARASRIKASLGQ